MMSRKSLAMLLGALMLLAGVTTTGDAQAEGKVRPDKVRPDKVRPDKGRPAQAVEVLEGATLAPLKSPWGKVFDAWAKAVKKRSNGKLALKWYFGSQGDEGNMVAKLRSGQLDFGAFTSVGLSKIYFPMLILQSPGLFRDWETLDNARDALWGYFQKGAQAEGFMLIGSGDVGLARTMSKGRAIRAPKDLKTMKVYAWDQDKIAPVMASVVGYTPVLKSVPGLLPALSSGQVNVITVPSLAATQLQWWSHLDHVNTSVAGIGIGGLVIRKKRLDALPGDLRTMFIKTGKKAGRMLTTRIRNEDKKAYRLIRKRMTVVKLRATERARWRSVFKKVRGRLAQGTFDPALMAQVESLAGL